MGLGFTVGLTLIGMFRELIGAGTLFGIQVMIKKSLSTTQIIALGFFVAISIGTALLMLPVSSADGRVIKAVYDKYYANEQFVRVLDKDVCPQTKWVEGSNYVDVNFKIDPRTKRIIMMGAMDNLVKGAAGQAVQNMNLMFGLPENEGLCMPPMFP